MSVSNFRSVSRSKQVAPLGVQCGSAGALARLEVPLLIRLLSDYILVFAPAPPLRPLTARFGLKEVESRAIHQIRLSDYEYAAPPAGKRSTVWRCIHLSRRQGPSSRARGRRENVGKPCTRRRVCGSMKFSVFARVSGRTFLRSEVSVMNLNVCPSGDPKPAPVLLHLSLCVEFSTAVRRRALVARRRMALQAFGQSA